MEEMLPGKGNIHGGVIEEMIRRDTLPVHACVCRTPEGCDGRGYHSEPPCTRYGPRTTPGPRAGAKAKSCARQKGSPGLRKESREYGTEYGTGARGGATRRSMGRTVRFPWRVPDSPFLFYYYYSFIKNHQIPPAPGRSGDPRIPARPRLAQCPWKTEYSVFPAADFSKIIKFPQHWASLGIPGFWRIPGWPSAPGKLKIPDSPPPIFQKSSNSPSTGPAWGSPDSGASQSGL